MTPSSFERKYPSAMISSEILQNEFFYSWLFVERCVRGDVSDGCMIFFQSLYYDLFALRTLHCKAERRYRYRNWDDRAVEWVSEAFTAIKDKAKKKKRA